ncbi:MAG: DEAD/DEAH box helicase [Muribaculaceae bacterium]
MLRDYQSEICGKINKAFETHRSVMMQMPTGTGKTVVLASLVQQFLNFDDNTSHNRRCTVLIVAHRIELIEQAGAFMSRFGIDYGVIARGKRPATFRRVMVASIQSLANNLDIDFSPSLVIIDEAHHAPANTYRMLWAAWKEAKFLGLTATPYRISGDGFTDLFELLVSSWSVKRFIAEGWLSPYDYYSIRPDSEAQKGIDALKKRGADGDFQMNELREALDVRPSIARLFESFRRIAFDKKGIIYAIDIAHAEHIAEFYRLQGVNAVAISSKTPAKERAEVIRTFKEANSIQILVSVDLFSEGFDCPDVEFIQLARPTLSLAKYLQMVGRGLRPSNGKQCCTIIDNVGLYRTFGLPSADRDWEYYFLGTDTALHLDFSQNDQFLWLGCGDLQAENETDIIKIASHEALRSHFRSVGCVGFERRKKGGKWVWTDLVNGIEFERHPRVINYRGIEMSTADGDTFFPRLKSRWLDSRHGINRKALETQVGDGVGWMKLYISAAMPGKVLQLQAVKPNRARIYNDEQGALFLQQDLDHTPVIATAAGGIQPFMAMCDRRIKVWQSTVKNISKRILKPEYLSQLRNSAGIDVGFHKTLLRLQGESREIWVDLSSGFYFLHQPKIAKRGFVELIFDGDIVFIRNIREERFIPHRNCEIRADDRICVIGNKLYFSTSKDTGSFRIKKRSDDFRLFIVEGYPADNSPKTSEFIIINNPNTPLEITRP